MRHPERGIAALRIARGDDGYSPMFRFPSAP
jgi:hypothetical protein